MSSAILRLPAVKERTGLGRSSIYAYIKANRFPRPVAIGPRSVGWHSADIEAWVQALQRTQTNSSHTTIPATNNSYIWE